MGAVHGEEVSEPGGQRDDPCPLAAAHKITWWDQFPERLNDELQELDRLDVRWKIDETARAAGVLRLDLSINVGDEPMPLIATFPDNYPYFPFAVQAPSLDLPHHQHPFGKNLCLLPRSTEWWLPETDRLAHFLRDRLETVISAGRTSDANEAATSEEHIPEPFSDYYPYQPDTIVLIAAGETGDDRVPATARSGTVILGVEGATPGQRFTAGLRAALLEVRDERGAVVLQAPAALTAAYPVTIEGRWARRNEPVGADSMKAAPEAVYRASAEADLHHGHPKAYPTKEGLSLQVRAVLFPEEHRWRGATDVFGDGWAFAVRLQHPQAPASRKGGHRKSRLRGAPAGGALRNDYYLARPGRYAPGDLIARAPELAPLRGHTIALFGLGCVGSPSAIEFARSGIGGLHLLDHDVVDPATTVRWQYGLPFAGRSKAAALRHMITAHYPYVRVHSEAHQIGMPRAVACNSVACNSTLDPRPEHHVLDAMLNGSSLVYDATAEWGLQRFLADTARDRGMPYVSVQGTPGGWGGLVVRIIPGETEGCWLCLQHWRNEPIDAGGIAPPPSDDVVGDVHPQGCANATYTGANVDLSEVALQGVRTAIGILARGVKGGYPPASWDIAVLALRDATGSLTVPQWSTYRLRRHPQCVECAGREEPSA